MKKSVLLDTLDMADFGQRHGVRHGQRHGVRHGQRHGVRHGQRHGVPSGDGEMHSFYQLRGLAQFSRMLSILPNRTARLIIIHNPLTERKSMGTMVVL